LLLVVEQVVVEQFLVLPITLVEILADLVGVGEHETLHRIVAEVQQRERLAELMAAILLLMGGVIRVEKVDTTQDLDKVAVAAAALVVLVAIGILQILEDLVEMD
jgi:hypothetical protein